MDIHELTGEQPHPLYAGWPGFLNTCQVVREVDGVRWYRSGNCNFILFPDGLLVRNYAYWGRVFMDHVAERGWKVMHRLMTWRHGKIRRAMAEACAATDRLAQSLQRSRRPSVA